LLWLHSHFLNWTGGHQYVFEVVKRLRARYPVFLLASAASDRARQKFAEIGVDLHTINNRSTNSAAFWFSLPAQLRAETERIRKRAPVDSARATISSMFPMNVVATKLGRPHIQLCWEPYALFWDRSYLKDFRLREQLFCHAMRIAYGGLDLRSTRGACTLLTLSEFNRSWIDRVYGRSDARITYEGVDTEFFRPKCSTELEAAHQGRTIILHSTDFTAIKGTEHLIRALPLVRRSVPNVRVLVTHTLANVDQRRRMEKLAEDLGVRDVLEFIGRVEYDLLPAYYTRADIVVQPSVNQSMSLSVKEAMACGTPVVTSLEGYEQTQHGDAGFLVDPRDANGLAAAVVGILSDSSLANRMGERGREIVATRFSWDAVAGVFERAIEDIQ
jgi:glycosyltransferase involved in cell wall biosynthesis